MVFEYTPKGVCSSKITLDINEDDRIESMVVTNGCNGNLKGISSLVRGMDVDKVIEAFDGIECGYKKTSCPDQIARALKAYKEARQ
ncbi:MAG: TIGR03905 family TSCPD domain-containing protein [Erysipelotrichaceae bacterium]|nr:TIGR03905 family TSCPD domain-containing protein [Erysipelotrichaceae bacterium]MBO7698499.1 TIGR03905 family TSCPD domain-containing protein [Erysipelotrichaceae bacterium]